VPARAALFDVYASGIEQIGCTVRMGKCAIRGPSGLPKDLDLPEEMKRPEKGVVGLGVPMEQGLHYNSAGRAKFEIHVQHLDTLSQLLPMLMRCYGQRPSHLAHTVAPLPAEIGLFRAFAMSACFRLWGGVKTIFQ
jgi:hypothetical protein